MSDLEIIDEVKASSSGYEGEDSSSVSETKDSIPISGHIEANPLHDGADSDTNQGTHINFYLGIFMIKQLFFIMITYLC